MVSQLPAMSTLTLSTAVARNSERTRCRREGADVLTVPCGKNAKPAYRAAVLDYGWHIGCRRQTRRPRLRSRARLKARRCAARRFAMMHLSVK